MTIQELRKSLNLSQEAFAKTVGLTSKSYVSELESADEPRCSVKVALEIERLSGGAISAASLNPDVALIRGVDNCARDAAA
jgi:DNA-binding XRE family transcriptional regulator